MVSYTVLNLVLVALQVGAALWLSWRGGGILALAVLLLWVQLIAAVLAGVLCWICISGLAHIWRFASLQLWALLKASAPIAVLGLLGILYQRLSLIILPELAGAATTGWYSASARVVEAAKVAHVAVFTALYPMMAQAYATDKSAWSRNFRLPWMLLFSGAAIGSLALSLLAVPVVSILYGGDYASSASILRILAWMLIPYTINAYLSLSFLAVGEQTVIARALTVSILLLTVLTMWWEPLAGPPGAAWAALCAEVAQSVILIAHDSRQHRIIWVVD